MSLSFKGSKTVDLDKVAEVARHNPRNAVLMLVTYLKLMEGNKKNEKDT